jgi:UDP-glucose 4-epimerase
MFSDYFFWSLGAGYIGSHMVHALVENGKTVVVFDNLSAGVEWAIPAGVDLALARPATRPWFPV